MYGYGRRFLRPDPTWRDAEFRRMYKWLLQTQWWPRDKLQELQLTQLKNLLVHAYETVPYYRRLFRKQGITPESIVTLQDLQKLPFTTRKDVQQNLEDFLSQNMALEQLQAVVTGGTTGIPLMIYHERTAHAHEEAFRLRHWTWAGYRPGDRLLILRDDFLGREDTRGRLVKWDFSTSRNALVLSTFHLNEQVFPHYISLLHEFQPKFISAFPSALGILASSMIRYKIDGIRPNAIFCQSETIYPWQRELIESQFECKIFAGYGNSERAMDAVECERHEGYHVCMEYGILEIVDEMGNPVEEEGQDGTVVGTGFDTYCMPMIRYKTDDIATYTQKRCSCGRDLPLIQNIVGRLQEVVVTSDNERIPLGVLQIRSSGYRNVEQFQFLQEKRGRLILRIVPAPLFSEIDANLILDELKSQFHNRMKVQLVRVSHIPKTKRGKHRFLVQKLALK